MAFRILLTESSSPLGSAVLRGFEIANYAVICPTSESFDWSDLGQVSGLLEEVRPALLINTLAWSTADDAVLVDRQHTVLASACKELDLSVIHLSSHEVFGSETQDAAIDETEKPNPEGSVGERFLIAEQNLIEVPRHIILRLPWLVDIPGGLLDQVCQSLTEEEEVCLTDAWRGCPVQKSEVARVVLAMVHQVLCGAENWGVFHLHTSDSCSEAEFADLVARLLQKGERRTASIVVVGRQQRWIRSNGWLGGVRCTNQFGIQLRSWRQGIKTRVQAWVERDSSTRQTGLADPLTRESLEN